MNGLQVTGQVDGKKALLAMIALDEIRGRLAEARAAVWQGLPNGTLSARHTRTHVSGCRLSDLLRAGSPRRNVLNHYVHLSRSPRSPRSLDMNTLI